ncbi:uncharacterized protein LOC143240680 isoform X1 [Tachypleus tridentatus]|uniref:uncharacterized protein LOC143240680 isoform X1 n=1 Tax=Tachypleus tridentatus TaxID=6853 RepID=UPI003FCF1283
MDRKMKGAGAVYEDLKPFAVPESEPPPKRRRTAEDFFSFCQFILEYENYDAIKQEELRLKPGSPVGSSGSTEDNFSSDSNCSNSSLGNNKHTDVESEEDSWDMITCFCMKPFAGRPMIECSRCLTWVHLSCAKIRRNNIPEEFSCQHCKESSNSKRRSERVRGTRRLST